MSDNLPALREVEFEGSRLAVIEHDGAPYVALKPIAEAIGLGWDSQLQKVRENAVLGSTIQLIVAVGGDGKQREMAALPLKFIPGWLFSVSANKVSPEARPKLIVFQQRCYDVLAEACGVGEPTVPALPAPALTEEAIKALEVRLQGSLHDTLRALMQEVMPMYVQEALLRGRFEVIENYWSVGDFLDELRVPSLGRRSLVVRCAPKIKTWCMARGVTAKERIVGGSRAALYPLHEFRAWYAAEGKAMIERHLAERSGAQDLPFGRRKPRKLAADGHSRDRL